MVISGLPPVLTQSPYQFNTGDLELGDLLVTLGMARNLAMTALYLSRQSEAISRHIEVGTGLKQPEVSTAVATLRDLGWITERRVKRSGKGRPTHVYRLAKDFSEIVAEVEKQSRAQILSIRANLDKLKSMMRAPDR